ncbi:MAG TPA: hypothetical protein VFH66_07070 [Mycobacteriales bacterium]|nr:hypothetical protein [Mycobacteriales bacterium]
MYVWIWRRLPGGIPGKLAGSLVLLAAALALLFFLVFPWAERRLPFQDITVDNGPSPQPTVTVSTAP